MFKNIKSKTDLSYLYLVYNTSSSLEKEGYRGISHLVEHVMCEKLKEHEDEMSSDGINFNAYTSSNRVVFHMDGLERKMKKWRGKAGGLTPNKAREILHDKSVHGKELTDKQRRFFGAMSKGHTNYR